MSCRIKHITGSIVDPNLYSKFDALIHQCNTKTTRPANLSKTMFEEFKWADVYANNPGRVVGTYDIRTKEGFPAVVALYGQRYPGKSKWSNDQYKDRMKWFETALDSLFTHHPKFMKVLMPKRIGCGAAGGDWIEYEKIIQRVSVKHQHVEITIVSFTQ